MFDPPPRPPLGPAHNEASPKTEDGRAIVSGLQTIENRLASIERRQFDQAQRSYARQIAVGVFYGWLMIILIPGTIAVLVLFFTGILARMLHM